MTIKKWDIPWNAAAALIDWAALEADEIAVVAQIINLIYAQNRRIKNEPENIKTYIKKMSRARCEKVIHSLIHKGVIFEENGELFHKKCEEILKKREESHDKFSLFGKNGAKVREENKQKQGQKGSPPSDGLIPVESSSKSSSESSIKTSLSSTLPRVAAGIGRGSFSIWDRLTSEGEVAARSAAPGWDIRKLAEKFDAKVKSGAFVVPDNPDSAFPAWCGVYTKGKSPK